MNKPSLHLFVAVTICFPLVAVAQDSQPTSKSPLPWQVSARDAHESVWESVSLSTNETTGEISADLHSFLEIATGLNFIDDKTRQWTASVEVWQVFADGIVFQTGRHKVILANDISLAGAVDLLTP